MVEWAEKYELMLLQPVPGNKRGALALSPLPFFFFFKD